VSLRANEPVGDPSWKHDPEAVIASRIVDSGSKLDAAAAAHETDAGDYGQSHVVCEGPELVVKAGWPVCLDPHLELPHHRAVGHDAHNCALAPPGPAAVDRAKVVEVAHVRLVLERV
jgi:hypothetical protein